jgi:hypothetical protein
MPNADYWAALMWRRTVGTQVLDAGPIQPGLHIYAHSLRGRDGGVALLVINTDKSAPRTLHIPVRSERYTLSTRGDLQSKRVQLNGKELKLEANDELPDLAGARADAGDMRCAPATITFLALPDAGKKEHK